MTTSRPPAPDLPPRPRHGPRRAAAALTGLLALLLALAPAAPATADARVTLSSTTADPDYATRIQLHGAGFQSVKNGFGGLYVLFGTVSGDWRPSRGGTSGVDYVYVQDSETKDNHGYQRFVAFPGDPTAYAANGGTLKSDGTWDATLIVPGAVFPARGRDGAIRQIDCREVQCGVITIGAHGVVSPANETFTPVDFAAPAAKSGAKERTEPRPTKTEANTPAKKESSAAPTPSRAATPAPADPRETSTTPTTGPPASVAAEPTAGATSPFGVGRLAVSAAALAALVLLALLLLRRRRRAATSTTPPEEK